MQSVSIHLTFMMPPGGPPVEDVADRFLELIHDLEDIANSMPARRALEEFDETTLQVFWKKWPHVSGWAGSLWTMLSAELSGPSTQHLDPDLDEIGESG
jgi:hypothetical protein